MNNFIVLHNRHKREILVNPAYILEVSEEYSEGDAIFTKIYYQEGSSYVLETVEEIKNMLIDNTLNNGNIKGNVNIM